MGDEIPSIEIDTIEVAPLGLIESLPPVVTRQVEPPVIQPLQQPVLGLPSEAVPSYEPIKVEPPVQKPKVPASGNDTREVEQEAPSTPSLPVPRIPETDARVPQRGTVIEVPFTEFEIPVPTSKEVTLAGTTAVAATASALLGKSLVEYLLKIFKPLAKKGILAIKKAQGKKFTEFELQDHFLFENEPDMKKVVKVLAKEQKKEKLRQALEQMEQ